MTLKQGPEVHPRSNVKTDSNSQRIVSYLHSIQCWHLSLTVCPQHVIYRCLPKCMTLNYESHGQLRSNVKTDLNSQYVVSDLLPIQTMALYVIVFEIFNIFVCMGNPIPTPNFGGFWGKTPQNRNGL